MYYITKKIEITNISPRLKKKLILGGNDIKNYPKETAR